MDFILKNLAILESSLPKLQQQRNTGAFANDVYEAVDDWCHFARRAVENDTRVNYPFRARNEFGLLGELREILRGRSSEEQQ
jgi:hypothetical protein